MDTTTTNDISNFPLFPPPSSPLFCNNWAFLCHDKGSEGLDDDMAKEELKQALLYATIELESTRAAAQEQVLKMDQEVTHLRALVESTTRERDEARHQCHHALLLLHNTNNKAFSSDTSTLNVNIGSASSEESSIVSSPPAVKEPELDIGSKKELPEKGRLLEAVMKAGPLLQNLLLAGPLPQWRHPPPPLRSYEIPPVAIGGGGVDGNKEKESKKRKDRDGDMNMNMSSPSYSWSPTTTTTTTNGNGNGNVKFNGSSGSLPEAVEYN